MERFQPEIEVKVASRYIQKFLWNNHSEILKLINKYVFLLFIVLTINLVPTYLMFSELSKPDIQNPDLSFGNYFFYFMLFTNIFIAYVYAVIAISWHRMVILGKDRFKPVNMLFPEKNEIFFVLAVAFLGAIMPVWVMYIGHYVMEIVEHYIGFDYFFPLSMMLMFVCPLILFIFFSFKMSFYFPAKAIKSNLSISDSFILTSGFFWKMTITLMRVSFIPVLILIAYFYLATKVPGFVMKNVSKENYILALQALVFLINLPWYLFFQPLLTIIGVTVVSNYYLCALAKYKEEQP